MTLAENKPGKERRTSKGAGRQMGTGEIAACGQGGRDAGQEARAPAPTEATRRAVPPRGCRTGHGPITVSDNRKSRTRATAAAN